MPDIAMCRDENCVEREKCYRFTARPNPYWQVYFETPKRDEHGKCLQMMPLFPQKPGEPNA